MKREEVSFSWQRVSRGQVPPVTGMGLCNGGCAAALSPGAKALSGVGTDMKNRYSLLPSPSLVLHLPLFTCTLFTRAHFIAPVMTLLLITQLLYLNGGSRCFFIVC